MIEAQADASTWITLVKGDIRTFEEAIGSVMSGGRQHSSNHYNSIITFFHETTHFWHSLSTNFLYEYSCAYFFRSTEALNQITGTKDDNNRISDLFDPIKKMLRSSSDSPVHAIDIIEGSAVFNSYRICVYKPSHEDFLQYLHHEHPGQAQYQKAYQYAAQMLEEDAFELFSPICYVALQTPDPGLHFVDMISKILVTKNRGIRLDPDRIQKNPLALILEIMNTSADDHLLPFTLPYLAGNQDMQHPILSPYFKYIAQITRASNVSNDWAEDLFARPYQYIRQNFSGLSPTLKEKLFYGYGGQTTARFVPINDFRYFKLVSPIRIHVNPKEAQTMHGLVTYSHPISIVSAGLGKEIGEDYLKYVRGMTALIGIIRAIQVKDKDQIFMYCPHQSCPIYKTKICIKYYAFPHNDYKECEFPDLVRIAGLKLRIHL